MYFTNEHQASRNTSDASGRSINPITVASSSSRHFQDEEAQNNLPGIGQHKLVERRLYRSPVTLWVSHHHKLEMLERFHTHG